VHYVKKLSLSKRLICTVRHCLKPWYIFSFSMHSNLLSNYSIIPFSQIILRPIDNAVGKRGSSNCFLFKSNYPCEFRLFTTYWELNEIQHYELVFVCSSIKLHCRSHRTRGYATHAKKLQSHEHLIFLQYGFRHAPCTSHHQWHTCCLAGQTIATIYL
jgi:hypothetical protein